MENVAFNNSTLLYYNQQRKILRSFVQGKDNIVLDIGCASGVVGKKLLESGKASEVVGVEIFPKAADEAKKYYTKVYTGNVEEMTFNYDNYFDYVICGDILEHLTDPWAMLKNIHTWLKDQGSVIISIPNIRNFRIIKDLLFFGRWEYRADGILDKTHLRFFTRSSFLKSLIDANFKVVYNQAFIHGNKKKIFNKCTFSVFEDFLCTQFIFIAQKKME